MLNKIFFLVFLALPLCQRPVRAAAAEEVATTRVTGSAQELQKRMESLSSSMGKVVPASVAVSSIPAGSLMQMGLFGITRIQRGKDSTTFWARHAIGAAGYELLIIKFPGDVNITEQSVAMAIGWQRGTYATSDPKVQVAEISARALGIINGGKPQPNGTMTFSPKSPIRIYQIRTKP